MQLAPSQYENEPLGMRDAGPDTVWKWADGGKDDDDDDSLRNCIGGFVFDDASYSTDGAWESSYLGGFIGVLRTIRLPTSLFKLKTDTGFVGVNREYLT
jgi:hypothetical protein